MFTKYFELIDGIEIYPLISLFIFLLFFIVVTVWSLKVKKNYLEKMASLPLEDDGQH